MGGALENRAKLLLSQSKINLNSALGLCIQHIKWTPGFSRRIYQEGSHLQGATIISTNNNRAIKTQTHPKLRLNNDPNKEVAILKAKEKEGEVVIPGNLDTFQRDLLSHPPVSFKS